MVIASGKKTVLITGSSGGLGRALCKAFSKGKYSIGVHAYRNIPEGVKLVRELNSIGVESAFFVSDFRDPKSIRKMFDDLLATWGQIDLLINNAGIRHDRLFTRIDQAEWDEVIDVNLKGAFLCMQEAARAMQKRKRGHIINISSYAAMIGRTGQASYTASKRGLIALTQSAAKEWGEDSIQVNTVFPGFLSTAMTATVLPSEMKRIVGENSLKRTSTLEEISEFIFHLSSMKNVSGQIFNLDSRIF
jgi:3-oxoacyl-[acyl-carrier protein] reductase